MIEYITHTLAPLLRSQKYNTIMFVINRLIDKNGVINGEKSQYRNFKLNKMISLSINLYCYTLYKTKKVMYI